MCITKKDVEDEINKLKQNDRINKIINNKINKKDLKTDVEFDSIYTKNWFKVNKVQVNKQRINDLSDRIITDIGRLFDE
jgi:uncharacterized membrane protein YheB (UPF0754 family)